MVRFFLFVAVAWLALRIVKLLFRSVSQSPQQNPKRDNNFTESKPNSEVEFKDVQDADFVDIKEKENVSK
jgi:hypothetical protein